MRVRIHVLNESGGCGSVPQEACQRAIAADASARASTRGKLSAGEIVSVGDCMFVSRVLREVSRASGDPVTNA